MAIARYSKSLIFCLIVALCTCMCGGCNGLKYHNIYMAGAGGALIGAIVGHQSDECAAGAAVGAALFATGELLRQIDNLPEKEKELEEAAAAVARGECLCASR